MPSFATLSRLLLLASLFFLPATNALKIAAALNVLEYTPMAHALSSGAYSAPSGTSASIVQGGVPNLFSDSSVDLAANAETQALRNYASHKDLRLIYTVAEVAYRIVAPASVFSGTPQLAALKGKRIGAISSTSSAYFVERIMDSVGVPAGGYSIVGGSPGSCNKAPCGQGTYPQMVTAGQVDAVGFWEPTLQLAYLALEQAGKNPVAFQNRTAYREIYSLYSTSSKLQNAATRAQIVAFVKALHQTCLKFQDEGATVWTEAAQLIGMDGSVAKDVWADHWWNTTIPGDVVDVLVKEDAWVAKNEGRQSISKADLQAMVDTSVLSEAFPNGA